MARNSESLDLSYSEISDLTPLENLTNLSELSLNGNYIPETIGVYISTYKESGLEGLAFGHSTGRPSKLSKEQKAILLEAVSTQFSADVGFTARYNWTLAFIVKFVGENGVSPYSLGGMSRVLERLGLSHTRPTYTLVKADFEKQKVKGITN